MALTHDMRRALAERVQRRVEGRGISRQVVDDAVARVGDALDPLPLSAPLVANDTPIIAVFSAVSAPDLGSRVRAALESESVTPLGMGSGSSGRHTVTTVRLPEGAEPVAERVAARLSASVSFISDSSTRSSPQ